MILCVINPVRWAYIVVELCQMEWFFCVFSSLYSCDVGMRVTTHCCEAFTIYEAQPQWKVSVGLEIGICQISLLFPEILVIDSVDTVFFPGWNQAISIGLTIWQVGNFKHVFSLLVEMLQFWVYNILHLGRNHQPLKVVSFWRLFSLEDMLRRMYWLLMAVGSWGGMQQPQPTSP